MHRTLRPFELLEPESIPEALQYLSKCGAKGKVLAGGLDLIQKMRRWQIKQPACLVSIRRIPGLNYIRGGNGRGLRIGPMTSIRALELSPEVKEGFPVLWEAAHQIASIQVKTMGTVIGNLCVATPASDIAPVLYILGAKLRIAGPDGKKTVAIEDFFIPVCQNILEPDQFVTELTIPAIPAGSGAAFMKLAHTKACIARVNAAAMVTMADGVCKQARIALGAVAPTVIRASKTEKLLRGKKLDKALIAEAGELAAKESKPISDLRGSAWYRKEMVAVLVRRALELAAERAK
ncbi:MAG: xanthine dehydrogenase family protein subunit M [Dehalococcoidia bacterium]|nr:xanthine dehydrogenase family protein subunit M [Dehalococcoidia bacterium]